jgi:hypothetical protein
MIEVAAGHRRVESDHPVAFPDPARLRDLDPGETALLVDHDHLPADGPDRSRHAVFDAEVLRGEQLEDGMRQALWQPEVQCLHLHSARRGCFFASARRANPQPG